MGGLGQDGVGVVRPWAGTLVRWGCCLALTTAPVPGFPAGSAAGGLRDEDRLDMRAECAAYHFLAREDGGLGVAAHEGLRILLD